MSGTERDKIAARIRKLLALGKSANAHEAALAMERAQALMAEHGLDAGSPELHDIAAFQAAFRPTTAHRWPRWASALCLAAKRAFGVEAIRCEGGFLWFYGERTRAEIAAYAFDTLARQCAGWRKEFSAKQSKRLKRTTKIARADQFAEGWVVAASGTMRRIVPGACEQQLLARFCAERWGETGAVETRAAGSARGSDAARIAGYVAGKNAGLEFGVGAAGTTASARLN